MNIFVIKPVIIDHPDCLIFFLIAKAYFLLLSLNGLIKNSSLEEKREEF
jgi:hypothetical protein